MLMIIISMMYYIFSCIFVTCIYLQNFALHFRPTSTMENLILCPSLIREQTISFSCQGRRAFTRENIISWKLILHQGVEHLVQILFLFYIVCLYCDIYMLLLYFSVWRACLADLYVFVARLTLFHIISRKSECDRINIFMILCYYQAGTNFLLFSGKINK